jgi:alpha-L-fucosidase
MDEKSVNLAIPTEQHLEWADCEVGVLFHCDIQICEPTYEYFVDGKIITPPDVSIFNPSKLDTDQWIQTAKAAGARYAVLTAKHGTGFVLFPDEKYDYSVLNTPFRDGKADIIDDFVKSCRKFGLKPGLYYHCGANLHMGIHNSTGDMPDKFSKDWKKFNEVVERHLTHLWSTYGEIFEIWFDGGILEGGPDIPALLKKYQPKAICFQGPKGFNRIRWVGNERGLAPYPCWSTIKGGDHNYDGTEETDALGTGDPDGDVWMPPETDVPLRMQEWMWKENQELLIAPKNIVMEWYYRSVGRNSNILLGLVINKDGLIPDEDVKVCEEFGKELTRRFGKSIKDSSGEGEEILLDLEKLTEFNHIILMEDIKYGQRIREFVIEGLSGSNSWDQIYSGTAIGHKHIIQLDAAISCSQIKIKTLKSVGLPQIRKFAIYNFEIIEDDW